METITVEFSREELENVIAAYQTMQAFLEKIVSPNELYTEEFLNGLREASADVENRDFSEVKDFAGFIE